MSTFKIPLSQLIEASASLAARIESSSELSHTELDAISLTVRAVLPMAERYERLFRSTADLSIPPEMVSELELNATRQWNTASLTAKTVDDGESKKVFCSVKLYCCLLLSIHDSLNPSIKGKQRLVSCLFKSLTNAIDLHELELANKLQDYLDRAFKTFESMKSKFDNEALKSFSTLQAELFITKMGLSLQENDFEMAKFYQERAQLIENKAQLQESIFFETCRLLYNRSLELFEENKFQLVIDLLETSTQYFDFFSDAAFSALKISIYSLIVRSAMEHNSVENLDKAKKVLDVMERNYPDSIESFKLAIKFHSVLNNDSEKIEELIMRMVMSVPINSNFKEILAIINDFARNNATSAIKTFEYAFTNRINPIENHEYLEMVLVGVINANVRFSNEPSLSRQNALESFFSIAEKTFTKTVTSKCSLSAVTILWNEGKCETKNGNFEDAIRWFKLAQNRLLNVNDIDNAKIQRALQNCLISLEKYEEAVEVYKLMDLQEQNALITQYNMFKVYSALRDRQNLAKCLKKLADSSDEDLIPLLSLCVLNSRTNSHVAIEAMLCLFKKLSEGMESKISIQSTLQSVIQLILNEIQKEDYKEEYLSTLFKLLSESLKFAKESVNIKSHAFSSGELEWLSSQAFNVARECLKSGAFIHGELMADISSEFNKLIKDDVSTRKSLDLKLWGFRSALISIMCHSKNTQISKELLCKSIREKSLNLRLNIDQLTIVSSRYPEYEEFKPEWEQCLLYCMIFQFEAEIILENWSAAESIINESGSFKTIEFEKTIINMVSTVTETYVVPPRIKYSVISQIIERNLGDSSIAGLVISRWVRLLLMCTTMPGKWSNDEGTLKILNQINSLARTRKEENQFPAHELEWISTTCWNCGISRLFNGEKRLGESWCRKALEFSRFVNERFETSMLKLWSEVEKSI